VKELVLDIETLSEWERLSPEQRAHLQKLHDPSSGETAASKAALSPRSGSVIVIGTKNPDTGEGVVFHVGPVAEHREGDYRFVPYTTERDMLAAFWAHARGFSRVVGWNSFAFDIPFLVARSIKRRVRSRWDWASKWYEPKAHLDLKEAIGVHGRARCYNLDYTTREHDVPSPKGDLSGAAVGEAWKRGEYLRVLRYCAADVDATAVLHLELRDFLPAGGR
jgi:hypothetical protein